MSECCQRTDGCCQRTDGCCQRTDGCCQCTDGCCQCTDGCCQCTDGCCQRTDGCCQWFKNWLVWFFCCCTRQRHRGYDTLDGSSNSSNNEAQHLREENEVLKERIFHYQEQLQLLKQSKDEALYSLNNEAQHLREEIAVLNQRIAGYEEQVQLLNRSKDEALSRLSEMMGNKLRDNNPTVTDLNDPNRPMKLGEQFKAIYENEWTDAFTILEDEDNKMTETQRIKVLLDILKEINEVSTNESLQQLSGIKQAVQNIPEEDYKEYLKSFKDTLKSQAARFITLLFKKIISDDSRCMTTLKYRGLFEPYIQKSVSVCYFAAVQDPPMFLDFEPAVEFDKHAFNVYTRSGTLVDFIVWPALLIQPGGGIISKGIVQPREQTN